MKKASFKRLFCYLNTLFLKTEYSEHRVEGIELKYRCLLLRSIKQPLAILNIPLYG